MPYVLFTDSASEITPEQAKTWDVNVIPMRTAFPDSSDYGSLFPPDAFYVRLKKEVAKTSAVPPEEIVTALSPVLESGNDALYVTMPSAISCTYENALAAKESLKERFPDRRIEVVDSRCACWGQGLLVARLADRKIHGATIDDLIAQAEREWKHIVHLYIVDDLTYLHRGGRVSKTVKIASGMLKIVPVMTYNMDGVLLPIKKVHGRRKAHGALVDLLKQMLPEPSDSPQYSPGNLQNLAILTHGASEEACEDIYAKIVKAGLISPTFEVAHGNDFRVGPIIGTHTGPSVCGIFFYGKRRDKLKA